MLLTLASFIFVLGILIFIHELGHFLVAKKVGVRVDKFSLGFPPNILAKKVGETTYCIGVIPLGGYVKMAGEHPDEESTGAPDEFMSKSVAQRTAVIFAGPFMNYVLSIVLLIGILYFGGRPLFDKERILVGQVAKESPAAQAGLTEDDQIIAVDAEPMSNFDTLRARINTKIEQPLELTWIHEGDTLTATMITMATTTPTEDGRVDTVGVIGFAQKVIGYEKLDLFESTKRGFVTAHVIVWETVKFIKKYVTGEVSLKMVGGPLFIAQQSGKEARKGATSLFFFMALLSVNLAVLNVLPIPVLDGGHLIFLAIEKVRGTPLTMKVRLTAQQIGFVLLLGLIVLVTYNDILRLFKGF
jgi:regulator of sigma E protease